MTHDLWSTLNAKMFDYLASVTLGELVERQKLELSAWTSVAVEDKRPGPQPHLLGTREEVGAAA